MAARGTVKPSVNFNAEQDAGILYKAMKGLGTNEDAILQLLTSRSNAQRQQIKAAYKTLHGKDLIDDLKGELGGKFETLIVALMTLPLAYDVTALRNAIKGAGTDEKVLVEILASRTSQQIKDIVAAYRAVFDAYTKLAGFEMEESIKRETSGNLENLLLAVVKCARSVPAYFAETLYYSMKGMGTDDETLIRVMATRSEVDLLDIRANYRRLFAGSLHAAINGDTSGDYRKALLLLCGGDDE
ncbi:hypothetical protein CRUP_032176 [Coryphaenoides rupestris]|nr:hypothetical protein CRUP_032176 [Coryphaenoides rupestris]